MADFNLKRLSSASIHKSWSAVQESRKYEDHDELGIYVPHSGRCLFKSNRNKDHWACASAFLRSKRFTMAAKTIGYFGYLDLIEYVPKTPEIIRVMVKHASAGNRIGVVRYVRDSGLYNAKDIDLQRALRGPDPISFLTEIMTYDGRLEQDGIRDLHAAIKSRRLETVRFLIDNFRVPRRLWKPSSVAIVIRYGDVEMLKYIVSKSFRLFQGSRSNMYSALEKSICATKKIEFVPYLLSQYVRLNIAQLYGMLLTAKEPALARRMILDIPVLGTLDAIDLLKHETIESSDILNRLENVSAAAEVLAGIMPWKISTEHAILEHINKTVPNGLKNKNVVLNILSSRRFSFGPSEDNLRKFKRLFDSLEFPISFEVARIVFDNSRYGPAIFVYVLTKFRPFFEKNIDRLIKESTESFSNSISLKILFDHGIKPKKNTDTLIAEFAKKLSPYYPMPSTLECIKILANEGFPFGKCTLEYAIRNKAYKLLDLLVRLRAYDETGETKFALREVVNEVLEKGTKRHAEFIVALNGIKPKIDKLIRPSHI